VAHAGAALDSCCPAGGGSRRQEVEAVTSDQHRRIVDHLRPYERNLQIESLVGCVREGLLTHEQAKDILIKIVSAEVGLGLEFDTR
jgi:hypothetical protein